MEAVESEINNFNCVYIMSVVYMNIYRTQLRQRVNYMIILMTATQMLGTYNKHHTHTLTYDKQSEPLSMADGYALIILIRATGIQC